jgi:hypothetical protein
MLANITTNNEEEELNYPTSLEEGMMKMDDKKETTPTTTKCVRDEMTNTNGEEKTTPWVTHSQLLEGLKCESKWKTTKEGGFQPRSLTHNTLRGKGTCCSFGMGLGRVDKLHSLTRAYTQPTQSG